MSLRETLSIDPESLKSLKSLSRVSLDRSDVLRWSLSDDVSDDWIPIYDQSSLPGYYMAIGTSGNQV